MVMNKLCECAGDPLADSEVLVLTPGIENHICVCSNPLSCVDVKRC